MFCLLLLDLRAFDIKYSSKDNNDEDDTYSNYDDGDNNDYNKYVYIIPWLKISYWPYDKVLFQINWQLVFSDL